MRCNSEAREFVPARGGEWSLIPTVGDLFQSFFEPPFRGANAGTFVPPLDLKEDAEGYTVAVDVPGFTMDQVDVQFTEGVLTLSAKQPEQVKEQSGNAKGGETRWHVVERSRGAFSRSIKFPAAVDAANVKAQLKGGVLTVTLPKGVEARAQKIKVTEA